MVYLAKRENEIPDDYRKAMDEFQDLYPEFNPATGMHLYLQDHWNQIE